MKSGDFIMSSSKESGKDNTLGTFIFDIEFESRNFHEIMQLGFLTFWSQASKWRKSGRELCLILHALRVVELEQTFF
jgi:hypothetical protein